MRRVLAGAIGLVAAIGVLVAPTAANAAPAPEGNGPAFETFPASVLYAIAHPGVAPSGANDWSCRPSAAHPRPVVLVHGTFANQFNSWANLSPKLKAQGYCVFSFNYGKYRSGVGLGPEVYGTGPVMDAARELSAFSARVRTATGAPQVDLVGYSQGAIVARGYLKFFGGANAANPAANQVKRLVSYAGTNHGTTISGLGTLTVQLGLLGVLGALTGPAVIDQSIGSAYLTSLNAGGDTMPGIDYTILTTRFDQVSTPYRASFLAAGPGASVNNIVLQDGCLIDGSDHLSITYSLRASDYTLRALDPTRPRTIRCAFEVPSI